MAQGVILSDKSRDGIAALVWRNMGDLEEDMWELENSTSETLEAMNASAQSAMEAVNNAESALTEMDNVLESLSLSRASRLNRPNLLKQNYYTSRLMPSSAVIVEEITVPAEDATAAAEALTFTITNEAITSSYVLHGVKSSDYNVVSWSSVSGSFSAGQAVITIAARSGAHNAAVTVKVALCTQSSQNVPYGNMSRTSGSGYPYLRSIYSGWYPGDDSTDNIYVSVASLAAADQITEPDGETYDKALQYSITANSAYANTEWLQYNHANYQSSYYQGNTPRNYGHIDELIPGKTYTVSFWARVISGDGAWARFGWGGNYYNAPYTDNDKMGRSDWVVIEDATWKRYWWTFTFNPQGAWYTETSEQVTVNNETKTRITRSYAWNKSVWFGIGRKFTSVVQLCGFRLVEGGMWLPTKYDELNESKLDKDQGSANAGKVMKVGANGKLEASSLQPDIQTAVDAVNANVAAAEEVTATAAHAAGELIMVGGALYKVTAAIAAGDTIASGTNVTPKTLAEAIAEILGLPSVSGNDNGKVLRVSNGAWAAESLPSASGVSF